MVDLANPNQHTEEWWLARRGRITGSRMHIIMDSGARAWKTFADKLRLEAVAGYTPEPDLEHVAAIAHGRTYEPRARSNAELALDLEFELPGFREHPAFRYIGCSADACTDTGVPVEIKCPLVLEKHMEVYRTQQMPAEHKPQVQCEIAVYGVTEALFVSYHPIAPHWKMRTVVLRVPRDEAYIDEMYRRCKDFMAAIRENRSPSAPRAAIPKLF